MIALYLLASHLVGDFVLQTRWQAERKIHDPRLRLRHVSTYTLAFAPLAFLRLPPFLAFVWLTWLAGAHFATDSRRFRSTLGDWLVWRCSNEGRTSARWNRRTRIPFCVEPDAPYGPPPNPWGPLPILIDQTLHVVQLAALGWLLA